MAKQLAFSEDARRQLSHGMAVLAEAVATTLGPKAATWRSIKSLVRRLSPTMA